jgi:hypothetical protein
MSRQEYTEIDNYNLSEMLFNRDERLIEMIKGLREERDYIFNKLTCEKGYLQEKLNIKEDIIDKAIEYINENWGHWCSNHCKYATETINILRGEE